jgi:hypothetical protein
MASLEDGFSAILWKMRPAHGLFDVAKAMSRDLLNMNFAPAHKDNKVPRKQPDDLGPQVEIMPGQIGEANGASVVSGCELRIEKLEHDKIVRQARIASSIPPKGRLEE